jgi:hypothetical protein
VVAKEDFRPGPECASFPSVSAVQAFDEGMLDARLVEDFAPTWNTLKLIVASANV